MSKYERPVVEIDAGMAEGVYAASGASSTGCYTVNAQIKQTPETGRENYVIQIDAHHQADHTRDAQTLTISFNLPVGYVSYNGQGARLVSGDGTNTLVISLTYHQNPTDNIGSGDLVVTAASGLAITGVSITD